MKNIFNWFKKKQHTKEVREWRHENNVVKSSLEKHNNKQYMKEYRQRPEVKEHHKLYMRMWRANKK